MVVNRTRLVVAVALLSVTHWVMFGIPLPLHAEPERWLWLGLSGIVGLVLGDIFLFRAFVSIGPRLSMLMMSLAPVIATIQAWIFLSETMSTGQMVGILITLGGITWVVMERNGNNNKRNRDYARGISLRTGWCDRPSHRPGAGEKWPLWCVFTNIRQYHPHDHCSGGIVDDDLHPEGGW